MEMEISLSESEKLVMSVSSTSTRLPDSANRSATASAMSGTSRHSTTGSLAKWMNMITRFITPLSSKVSLKKVKSSNLSPIPPRMMISASACIPTRASSGL